MSQKGFSFPRLYCIPGLGVDRRIFQNLNLPMPRYYLHWPTPQKTESLRDYALRMAAQIQEENPVLLGVSFGGVIAQEIAAHLPVRALILISTVTHPTELPLQLKIMRTVPLYQLGRGEWRIQTLPFWAPKFGIDSEEEQIFLKIMFRGFEDQYRMWATRSLLSWEGSTHSVPQLRLHGEHDKLFPRRYIKGATIIRGGRHFMISQHAPEIISEVLYFLEQNQLFSRRVSSNT